MQLTIVAATGGTGQHLVAQALAAGHHVTAVARRPRQLPEQIRVVTADLAAADPATLTSAVAGSDAVLSALGPRNNREVGVAARGTEAVLEAMAGADVRRLLVVSSESMTTIPSAGRPHPPKHDPGEGLLLRYVIGPPARRILRRQYSDLGGMEDAVRDSGLDWTIVRPALLIDRPVTGVYRTAIGQKPRGGFRISRADLAHFMLHAVAQPDTVGQAVTITN